MYIFTDNSIITTACLLAGNTHMCAEVVVPFPKSDSIQEY